MGLKWPIVALAFRLTRREARKQEGPLSILEGAKSGPVVSAFSMS